MGKALVVLLISLSALAHAARQPHYYGEYDLERSTQVRKDLFTILNNYHQLRPSAPDLITEKCTQSSCYKQKRLGYKNARKKLFGELHLEELQPSIFSIKTVYCQTIKSSNDFSKTGIGPNKIPVSTVINTEHSWPQSKFTSNFPKALQKADLHILFPVISRVNSIRGNRPFGNVAKPTKDVCEKAFYGDNAEGRAVFEPSNESKGDIARAVFYYSVRYKVRIDNIQENYLRQWHRLDPVDATESIRNEAIYSIQSNRNPFIDMPSLIDRISDF